MNDVVVNKVQSIQRCVSRARSERSMAGSEFATDFTRQDAAILNITRACEQAIDLANHVIKNFKFGIPVDSADSFLLLARQNVIDHQLANKMKGMVGFRNIAVHQYEKLDIEIAELVIEFGLNDLVEFGDAVTRYLRDNPIA